MEKFEYKYAFMSVARKKITEKLNELGKEGWEISEPKEIRDLNEFDSEGDVLIRWEFFMKRKI